MYFLRGLKTRPPNPNTVIQKSSKTIGKQAKRAEGPRYGISPAAATPSRAQAIQQDPYRIMENTIPPWEPRAWRQVRAFPI